MACVRSRSLFAANLSLPSSAWSRAFDRELTVNDQTLSVMIRYSLTSTPPTFHPLPRQPPLGFIRSTRLYRALDAILFDYRHINMPPNPPLTQSQRGWPRAVLSHLGGFMLHIGLMDLVLYPIHHLDPYGLGSAEPPQKPNDLVGFCVERAGGGYAWVIWWLAFAVALGVAMVFAMIGTYHLFAFLGIASGLYLDEEWPAFTDSPFVSDSLNDLWGKRYHQVSLSRPPTLPFDILASVVCAKS